MAVREPARAGISREDRPFTPVRPRASWRRLGTDLLGGLVMVGTVLTLARSSEAFLILRAQDLGLVDDADAARCWSS